MEDPAGARPTKTSLSTLAERIREGDPEAEGEFCSRYHPSVRRLLVGLCRDENRADDVTQEALLTVLVKLRDSGIDHPDRLTSYVHQTARFTLIGVLRQNPRFHFCETMDDHECDQGVEHSVVRDEQRDLVTRLIESLDVERDREVLFRCYISGEPKASICDALALTTTHFDRVISRARGRLRKAMETSVDDIREAIAV